MCHLSRIHKLCDYVGGEDVQMNMTLISANFFQSTHAAYETVSYSMCIALVTEHTQLVTGTVLSKM